MKKLLLISLLFFQFNSFAQKQFNNAVSVALGAEYFAGEDFSSLPYYYIFTEHPTYGVKLNYERKVGKFVSVAVIGGLFYGQEKEAVLIRDDQGNFLEETEMINGFWRWNASATIAFWVVQNKKYAFTPGLSFQYGQTLSYSFRIKASDTKESFSPHHQYVNVALDFTNRFQLSRLRSERKGTYGELQLLVTPYFAANVYKNLDWQSTISQEPEPETLFGGGLFVGLGLMF